MRVYIDQNDSDKVEVAFMTYNAYINILSQLLQDQNNDFLESKWDKCVELNIALERIKDKISQKYKPADEYINYSFDFNSHAIDYFKADGAE